MTATKSDLEQLLLEIRAEAGDRTLPHFGHVEARRVGLAVTKIAEKGRLPIAVAVSRGDQLVFHAAFEGTTAEHDGWLQRKANTVRLHEVPSLEFVLRQRIANRIPDWLDPLRYAVAGGAVPIVVDDMVVGVVAVTGLVDTIRADHDLAMAALHAVRIGA